MSVSSMSIETDKGSEMKPYRTMRGHTDELRGVAHLPDGQRIITCSWDGSLRLWERESGAQIGNDWRDAEDEELEDIWTMALSPNGKTVSSGSIDGTMRLWDVEMRKVIAKWTGHTEQVQSVCWSADGGRVASGSYDGTATVWDIKSGETVLGPIKTGHQYVIAVAFSPDASNLATGGNKAIKIWDGRTGELLSTLNPDSSVWSLVWTSDQKKLLAGNGNGLITIFNTATWQQITVLEDHTSNVVALSLFENDRLLASASFDHTVRLWNLDTNLPVGPPLHHQGWVGDTAFSPDGRFLATGCNDKNAYLWDVHTILQEAGLEHLISVPNVTTGKSILNSDATRRPTKPKGNLTVVPQGFFDSSTPCTDPPPSTIHTDPPPTAPPTDIHPSPACSDAPPSTHVRRHALAPFTVAGARALLGRVFPRFRRSQPSTVEPMELQQSPRPDIISPHGPADAQVPAAQGNQLDNPPISPHSFVDHSQDDIHPSATPTAHIQSSSSASIRNRRDAQLEGAPPGSGEHVVVDRFLPRFRRPRSNIDTSKELQQHPVQNTISGRNDPAVIKVPEIRDRETLYVAPPPKRVHPRRKNTWLARCLVFICCEPAEENGGN